MAEAEKATEGKSTEADPEQDEAGIGNDDNSKSINAEKATEGKSTEADPEQDEAGIGNDDNSKSINAEKATEGKSTEAGPKQDEAGSNIGEDEGKKGKKGWLNFLDENTYKLKERYCVIEPPSESAGFVIYEGKTMDKEKELMRLPLAGVTTCKCKRKFHLIVFRNDKVVLFPKEEWKDEERLTHLAEISTVIKCESRFCAIMSTEIEVLFRKGGEMTDDQLEELGQASKIENHELSFLEVKDKDHSCKLQLHLVKQDSNDDPKQKKLEQWRSAINKAAFAAWERMSGLDTG